MGSIFGGSGGAQTAAQEGATSYRSGRSGSIFSPGTAAPEDTAVGEAPYSEKASVNKKSLAETLQRLHAAGDATSFNKLVNEYGNVFTEDEVAYYGLDGFGKGESGKSSGWLDRFKENTGKAFKLGDTATGGALSGTLNALDIGRAAGVGGLRQAHAGLSRGLDALPGIEVQGADATKMGWEQFKTDVNERTGLGDLWHETKEGAAAEGDDTLFGSKTLQDSKWVDRGVGLVGDVGLDPLTYLSFGASSLAKASMKTIAEEMGKDVARKIGTYGIEGAVKKGVLTELEAEAARNFVKDSVKETVASAAKKKSIRKLVAEQGEEAATEALTDKAMREVALSGRSGLRVRTPLSGERRTLIPSHPFGKSLPGWDKFAFQTGAGRAAEAATGVERLADDILPTDAIEAVRNAPVATDAGGYGPLVDAQLPKDPGVVQVADEGGGAMLGIRDADGALEGYIMLTDDAVNTFENLSGRKGVGQELLQAASDAGFDMPKLLANSDFTEAGRGSALKFLGAEAPLPHPSTVDWKAGDQLGEHFDVLGRTDDGKDLFVQVRDEDALIPFERAPKRVSVQDSVATGGERAGNVKYGELKRGDKIPGVGMVRQVSDDGILRIFPDPEVLPPGADKWTLFPEGKAAAAVAEEAAPRLRGGVSSAPVRKGLGSTLRGTKAGSVLREAFVPRAKIIANDSMGTIVAQKLYGHVEQGAAFAGTNVNDMMLRIGKITDGALKELSGGPGEALLRVAPELAGKSGKEAWNDIALGVLEGTLDDVDAVAAALTEDGMEKAAAATAAYVDVARLSDEAVTAARGGADEAATLLPETKSRLPRILTTEGAELAKGAQSERLSGLLGIAPKDMKAGADLSSYVDRLAPEVERVAADGKGGMVQTLGQDTAALSGKTYAELPVKQLNADMVKRLNLPEGTKLFEDDAMTAVALRGKSAFEAAAQTNIIEGLAKETLDGSTPMVVVVRSSDTPLKAAQKMKQVEAAGYKQLEGHKSAVGKVFGPPEIMDELSKVNDVILNDESLRRMQQFLQKWNGVWASYATVPLVFGPGFHSRNMIGNQILSFMGGLTNPARIGEAVNIQWGYGRTRALMKKEGLSFEEALGRQVKSERTRQLIKDMRQHGILSNGFFADISSDEVDNVLRHNSFKDWLHASKYPARIADNKLIRSGRRVGDVIENNARVALYLDAYGKMGTVQAAADHVKTFLFDYGDLTPFERKNMKSLNRFYTFTRKNVAVQLHTLAMDPWRVKAPAYFESQAYGENGETALPDYAKKGGFNMAGFLGIPQGTEGVAANIDTPLDNMIRTLDPIAQAVTLIPGIRQLVPEQYRSSLGETAKATINLRAGGPVELVNFLVEEATGKDLFSGKDISEESRADTLKRFSTVIAPLYAKGANFQGSPLSYTKLVTGGFGDPDASHPGLTTRLALLQSIVGFQVLPITDKQINQVAYVGAQEAQNAIDKLKADGVDVPTYTDLVSVGLAPDLRAPTDPNAKRRSPEEAAQARVDKINTARTASGADPLTIKPPSGGGGRKKVSLF